MKYLIDSVSEMNFNYLYIDEKSLSYNELLKKFVLTTEENVSSPRSGRERSSSVFSSRVNSLNERDSDNYYNVILLIINIQIGISRIYKNTNQLFLFNYN